jgi:MOSC domain-containing protein YiiM
MPAYVVRLFLKTAHDRPMRDVPQVDAVAGKGLAGDVSLGRSSRQILLVDQATLAEFGLQPGQIRENITLTGLDLPGLPQGARIRIGEVTLEVSGDCTPCDRLEAIRPGLREAIRGRRGMLARVHTGGTIHVSDPVIVEPPSAG